MHDDGVPELARYVMGGLTILLSFYIIYGDEEECERLIVALTAAGLGVAGNRLRMALV